MSVKRYGIYLAYPPTVDLRHEGLGRYLAAFLKGASRRTDVEFTIVCPSWSLESLHSLFESERVPTQSVEIVAPKEQPAILRWYQAWLNYKNRKRRPSSLASIILAKLRQLIAGFKDHLIERIVTTESVIGLLLRLTPLLFLVLFFLLLAPLWLMLGSIVLVGWAGQRLSRRFERRQRNIRQRLSALLNSPKDDGFVLRMYRRMEEHESQRMRELIGLRSDVRAWYCPTAFWPSFNDIKAPRLMCVPDVVLADFPVGFANIGGERTAEVHQKIEEAIRGGEYFVTYCDSVKWGTLVDRYAVCASKVTTIRHAPNDLSEYLRVSDIINAGELQATYCKDLFRSALRKGANQNYLHGFKSEVKYLFYASQIRPNKNVVFLLRAFERLLRERFLGYKLILTGRASEGSEVYEYISNHNLQNEVWLLPGLTTAELAACYKLAQLSVCPSLSEGGGPFTYTESLSVGTPVLLAKMDVAEELIDDDNVGSVTFFDPYSTDSLVEKVLWALDNREALLDVQLKHYSALSKRAWADVVSDHIDRLEQISDSGKE